MDTPARLHYLASPYSSPSEEVRTKRYLAACKATALLLKSGILTVSPIAHGRGIETFLGGFNWETWKDLDEELIRRCDKVLLLALPGWEDSKGVAAELAFSVRLRIPVYKVTYHEELDQTAVIHLSKNRIL